VETVTLWHYHSRLDCGHRFWFDLARNLFIDGMVEDPTAEVTIRVTCPSCEQKVLATQLSVTTARDTCVTCGKTGPRQHPGRGIMT
jgi:phage terminase large subunit GpA-like protein